MGYLLSAVALVLWTLWDLHKGKADLFCWLGHVGLDVTREENGGWFWLAIVLQFLVALGLVAIGIFRIWIGWPGG